MLNPRSREKAQDDSFNQNDGRPGVVYILDNPALAKDIYKIGQTRHSGDRRAKSLNDNASTGTPGEFFCIFEKHTIDCGLAEKIVFKILNKSNVKRRGKYGQEYFELDEAGLESAKAIINNVCNLINANKVQEYVAPNPPKEEQEQDYDLHKAPEKNNPEPPIRATINAAPEPTEALSTETSRPENHHGIYVFAIAAFITLWYWNWSPREQAVSTYTPVERTQTITPTKETTRIDDQIKNFGPPAAPSKQITRSVKKKNRQIKSHHAPEKSAESNDNTYWDFSLGRRISSSEEICEIHGVMTDEEIARCKLVANRPR